jgi:hypothetical protein
VQLLAYFPCRLRTNGYFKEHAGHGIGANPVRSMPPES